MFVETRKTAQGTEYWDAKEKKTVFVPAGKEPDFEVTVDPKSVIAGVDLETGKDTTVINGQIDDGETDTNLNAMNAEKLLTFAAQNNIDVPGNMKKEETIRNHIAGALTAADTE